jgi:NAD(P)-dependent dehydrogenase (short-subunit alcohol dehydrogenase family)
MAADKVVQEIKALGGQAAANFDSVSTTAGAEAIITTAVRAFGRLDILVNNAGILRDKTLLKMEDELWDSVIAVHLRGTFACTRAAANVMKEQGTGGRIINTTSVAGLIGNFGQANYGSAKAGIYGFTRVAAMELIKYGITVNAISPLAITRLTEDLPWAKAEGVQDLLDPKFISPAVVYLASDLARDINGKIIGVQGRMLNAFMMRTTAGVVKETGEWTPQEIAKNIEQILGE